MSDLVQPSAPPNASRLRSGTAARLAGVPVSTLRVWERRYGVVAAPKTVTGQRLYSSYDVQRLRLIKHLTERGVAIGTIAGQDLASLQALAAESEPAVSAAGSGGLAAAPARLAVVGRSAARKLSALPGCDVQAVYVDLDQAENMAEPRDPAEVLLVHLPSLQPATAERVLALGARLQVKTLLVLYAFGAEPLAESLRAAGVIVRREPATGRELARLIASSRGPAARDAARWQIAAPRFTDDDLAHLAELPSTVACECPRHLAEILTQLAGFERYSADCTSRSPADAALHQHLSRVAGTARTLFEQALDRVMAAEGIVLSQQPASAAG